MGSGKVEEAAAAAAYHGGLYTFLTHTQCVMYVHLRHERPGNIIVNATGYDDNDDDGGGTTGDKVDDYGEGATGDDDQRR